MKGGSKAVWTTATGDRIRVCDMEDTHLDNTIAYLERKADAYILRMATMSNPFQGDIASAEFDEHQDGVLSGEVEIEVQHIFPIYTDMVAERQRRDLARAKDLERELKAKPIWNIPKERQAIKPPENKP